MRFGEAKKLIGWRVGYAEKIECRVKNEIFERLYRAHWSEVCAHVRLRVGDGPPDAEDIAQAVFEKYSRLPESDSVENPRAYLLKMARNAVIDHLRGRGGAHSLYENVEKIDDHSDEIDPERVLSARVDLELIAGVLKAMPKKRRRLFLLNRFDGLSYADISRLTGNVPSAVRKQVLIALEECLDAVAGLPARRGRRKPK